MEVLKNKSKDQMQNIKEQRPEYTIIWNRMLENDPNNGQTVRRLSNQMLQKDQKDMLAKHIIKL
jgi:hypothetical protein